jgi:hypothetical protein
MTGTEVLSTLRRAVEAVERIDALLAIGVEINSKPTPEAGLLQR